MRGATWPHTGNLPLAGNGKSLSESTDTNKQKNMNINTETKTKKVNLYWLECFVSIINSLVVTDKALFGIKAGKWGNYTA